MYGSKNILVVGYRLERRADILYPPFRDTPRKKAEAYKAEFEEVAGELGYCAAIVEGMLVDFANRRARKFIQQESKSGRKARPVACLMKDFIVQRYNEPPLLFGFEPKRFLKFLGLECAEAAAQEGSRETPCPSWLWWGHSNYRDIVATLIPEEFSKLGDDLTVPLTRLGLGEPAELAPGSTLVDFWKAHHKVPLPYTPFVDPEVDCVLVTEILTRMGFAAPVAEEEAQPEEELATA